MIRTTTRYVLLCALRDKLFLGLFGGIVVACIISAILGSTAFIESTEMTLAYAAASSRVILAVGLIVFICFHIRSMFDSRELDVLLTRPITRDKVIIAYWCGFMVVGLILLAPVVAVVGLIAVLNGPGFAAWAASLALETGIIVALALFAAFTLRSATAAVLAGFAMYILSRMMAFFMLTTQSRVADAGLYWVARVLDFISVIVPRLDFFGKTEWLVYGIKQPQDWQLYIVQAAIYIPLLLAAAVLDFRRRQF